VIITFLGTRGDIEESSFKHRNTSALVISHKAQKVLVDFGQGNTNFPEGITAVIISHAHPDHAFGLKGRRLDVPVYLNKFSNRILKKEDFPFRRKIFWRKPFLIGDIKVTPVPVLHSINAPTSGFIFEVDNRKLAYFPDVLMIRKKDVLLGVDVYIGDGATLEQDILRRKGNKVIGHASIRTQLKWLKGAKVKRAIFTHYGKWAMTGRQAVCGAFEALEKEFSVKIWEAYDGYNCMVGEKISLQRGRPGVYLEPPHARLIAEGLQTLIISANEAPSQHINRDLLFLQGKKCYGVLRILRQVKPQDAELVRTKFISEHQITSEEWVKWWPEVKKVYAYPFVVRELYLPPKDYKSPLGESEWIRHIELQQATEIQQEIEKESPYAPVHHYGEILGKKVTLEEILQYFEKPIVLKKGFITFMGGLTNWGETEGDLDVMQLDVREIPERDQPIMFRLSRALPAELAQRLRRRFIGEYGGVFTNHVPVYDLVLVPSTERRLIRMGRVETIKDTLARKQASQSLRENVVKPLRYVVPLKGYRGYYSDPDQVAIDSYFKQDVFPMYGQKKYDGVIVEWMKSDNTVIGRSDDGIDVTKRFPTLVKIIRETWPKEVTVLSETEMWVKGKHQPREVTSGYMMGKGQVEDSTIVSNVFDVMFFNDPKYEHHELKGTIGDLHDKPYELRYRYLKLVNIQQSTNEIPKTPGFNLTPSVIVNSPEELEKALIKLAGFIASEGAVLKTANSKYELDGLTRHQVKWKKMGELHAIVLEKIETKTKGIFNLRIGLRIPADWKVPKGRILSTKGKDYMYIGKTFNVAKDVSVGDIISLSFHTLNFYRNSMTDVQYVTVYEPKFVDVRPEQKQPDSAEEAVKIAREKEILTTKRLQAFPMDDEAHKAVMQNHYRGKSCHLDFRIHVRSTLGKELEGMTLFHQIKGTLTQDVETVAQAKAIERQWKKYFKLLNVPQTDIPGRRKIRVSLKKPEPRAWLTTEAVMPRGEVGATVEEEGVFSIVDRPTVWFGAQKPYFKEFFIKGKLIDGRWVVNYLPNPWIEQEPRTKFVYLLWKPEDQTPYVLTRRAVKKKWVPPFGVSALPPRIRNIIPEKFKYWNRRNISERLASRDELVTAIRKGEIKIADRLLEDPPDIKTTRTVPAVLQYYWERGQVVIRGGPSKEFWYLRVQVSETSPLLTFVLHENPLMESSTSCIFREERNHKWMKVGSTPLYLKPGTELNPSRATPAYIQTIDRGMVTLLESGNLFVKAQLNMKQLKGLWVFSKRDPRQNLWVASKEKEAP